MIKIMVDSASDCRKEDEAYDLFVPLTVSIGGKDYKDGVELNADLFYDLLVTSKEFPKTSQPSPEDFAKHFEQAKADGDEVICITLSSALSGTYQSACIARDMVDYGGIYIIDSLTATHMIAVLAKYAAQLVKEGLSAAEVAQQCEAIKGNIKVLAGLDTLEYLHKGGRLSRTSAAVGEMAGVKPIISVTEDGKVNAGCKVIGVSRAMQAIIKKLDAMELDERFPLCSLYTYGTENLEKFEQKLEQAGYKTAKRCQVGSTIGAHVGPGVYGVLFVTK